MIASPTLHPRVMSYREPAAQVQGGPDDVYSVGALTAVTLAAFLPVLFFLTYAFNDEVAWADHLSFLSRVVAMVVAVGVFRGLAIGAAHPMPTGRAVSGAVLISMTVLLTAGACYAFLSMFPVLDPAIGYTTSDLVCALYGALLSLSAIVSGLCGRRLIGSDRAVQRSR